MLLGSAAVSGISRACLGHRRASQHWVIELGPWEDVCQHGMSGHVCPGSVSLSPHQDREGNSALKSSENSMCSPGVTSAPLGPPGLARAQGSAARGCGKSGDIRRKLGKQLLPGRTRNPGGVSSVHLQLGRAAHQDCVLWVTRSPQTSSPEQEGAAYPSLLPPGSLSHKEGQRAQ